MSQLRLNKLEKTERTSPQMIQIELPNFPLRFPGYDFISGFENLPI